MQHTTHRGISTTLHPSLSCQFKTNEQLLRYRRLKHSVLTDTVQAGTVSRRGNRYTQVYSTEFGWSRAHTMNKKGDAFEILPLFFKRYGVPPNMVMDGPKKKPLGHSGRSVRRRISI